MKLGGGWMLVSHWIACIWWAIGMYEWNKQKYSLEPLPYSSWMIRVAPVNPATASLSCSKADALALTLANPRGSGTRH